MAYKIAKRKNKPNEEVSENLNRNIWKIRKLVISWKNIAKYEHEIWLKIEWYELNVEENNCEFDKYVEIYENVYKIPMKTIRDLIFGTKG